jgi:putative membrane protein
VRPYLLAPLAASPAVRAVFRFLSHPVVATLAMGGTLYVWQIPEVHDTAVLNERLHYVMHVTMLSSGLFFWWRVLDLRPPPVGLPYLYRLGMLKVAFMMETFLGAYLTSKEVVLYDVYDQLGLRGMTSLRDEMLGGMVLWVAGGLILMLGGLVVTVWWVREDRAHAAGSPPIARSALASGGLQPYSRLEGRGAV